MKITQVSYGFTKNLGNFQSQRLDVTVACENEFDDPDIALELAVAFVQEAIDAKLDPGQVNLLESYRRKVVDVRAEGIERLR